MNIVIDVFYVYN